MAVFFDIWQNFSELIENYRFLKKNLNTRINKLNKIIFSISDGISQRAFENTAAHIRCDVSTTLPNDQALLVVWYKNNLPIYR